MCLPHVTEHIVEGLQRRTFLGFVGGTAMARLVHAGEAMAAPRAPELDLDLGFAAQMEGSAIAYTLTLHNPHAQEIGRIHLIGPIPQGTIFRRLLEAPRRRQARIASGEVSWELPRIAPASSLGPFRYEVQATGEASLIHSHARVAWAHPRAGTAASPQLTLVAQAEAATRQTVVDLTHTLSASTPIWPGANPIQLQTLVTHDKDGYYANQWTVHEHHGTHADAPLHFGKGTWAADEIPEASLICPAAVIHVEERARANPDTPVTVDDLKAWEVKHGRIPSGAAVLMYSGWEARIGDQAAYRNMDTKHMMHFPGFSPEAAEFLLQEREINGIGVDTLGIDVGASRDFKVHYTILPANKWGLENLANLGKIPAHGATIFVGLPKVKGASGGPARVLAMW
jgi:kynurenine formamidase